MIAVPLVLVSAFGSSLLASLLTGDESEIAQDTAADVLRWVVPAGVAHLFAAMAASGLAAIDDYATAALAYTLGSSAGLALILLRVEPDGIIAVAWGSLLNGVVTLLVVLVGLALHAARLRMPRGAVRPSGAPVRARLGAFAVGAALPLALQLLYVVCLPFAARLGPGAATSFVYAYLASSSLVTVTAGSLGIVTSVPLSRAGFGAAQAARHVVATSWLALVLVGAAGGMFALAGGVLVEAVLGEAYAGDIGADIGRVVAVLSLWMIAAVGVAVTFPLAFVAGRTRALPWIALAALALQVPLAWLGSEVLELNGLALALAALDPAHPRSRCSWSSERSPAPLAVSGPQRPSSRVSASFPSSRPRSCSARSRPRWSASCSTSSCSRSCVRGASGTAGTTCERWASERAPTPEARGGRPPGRARWRRSRPRPPGALRSSRRQCTGAREASR